MLLRFVNFFIDNSQPHLTWLYFIATCFSFVIFYFLLCFRQFYMLKRREWMLVRQRIFSRMDLRLMLIFLHRSGFTVNLLFRKLCLHFDQQNF